MNRHPLMPLLACALLAMACGPDAAASAEDLGADSQSAEGAVSTTPELIKVMRACSTGPCNVRIVNNASQRCLALNATSAYVTETCSGSANQVFSITTTTQGFWSFNLTGLRHQSTGRCLTWASGAPRATTCDARNDLQRWYFLTGFHDEYVSLQATLGRGDVQLRDPSSHVVTSATAPRTLDPRQEWTFTAVR